MQPLDRFRIAGRQWIEKAGADLAVALRIADEASGNRRIREIVGFHCRQVAEPVADSLTGASWLTPCGVEIRYPGATAGMLPGDEVKAIHIAREVREVVLATLAG